MIIPSEQIHSRDGRGFGKGNLGPAGIRAFLAAHRCNPVCSALGCRDYGVGCNNYNVLMVIISCWECDGL